MANAWDNDPVVSTAKPKKGNAWDNDPIVGAGGTSVDMSGMLEKPEKSLNDRFLQGAANIGAGLIRGAGSIGVTALRALPNVLGGDTAEQSEQRKKDMDGAYKSMGVDTDSLGYGGGKLAGEVAGTAGAGGVLAKGAALIPGVAKAAPGMLNAIRTSGMTAGTPGTLVNGLTRAAGGGVTGGASAALINTNDTAAGAGIGAVAPGVLQLAGKLGGAVYSAVKGNPGAAGQTLAKALGVSEAELPAIIAAANAAPESITPGSKLTLSQALQLQGKNQPNVKMLERITAEGSGGNVLLRRYADQGEARLNNLVNHGAQKYQGAAATEAENTGNQLASLLRTQAGDEKAAMSAAWGSAEPGQLSGVHGRAVNEGAMLQIPTDRMKALVADRMGDGYTRGSEFTSKTIKEAERIGTELFDAVKPLPQKAINKGETLEQAVRRAGGMRGSSGELRDLGIRESGTTGMINNKSGQSADLLAERMHQRGFIPDADPATLYEALRNGAGRKIYAADFADAGFASRLEQSMGDMPGAERLSKAVPFKSFQALRSGAGSDAAALSEKAGNEVQSGVMTQFEKLMAGRADDAAAGNLLPGESMSPGLMRDYNAARGLTRDWHERYEGGNAISQILRKPVGQNYTLNGDEVTNKLWHGGSGLVDDVATLKRTLSDNNREPAMNQLRRLIMTDAADKTTASGNLGAALPKYVESRMPGLQEALEPNQLKSLLGVSDDIRNAESAAAIPGLRGSDSYAKIQRALDSGIFDSGTAKVIARYLTFKGVGGETIRGKFAELSAQSKSKVISELLANPKEAAKALENRAFTQSLDNESLKQLRLGISRAAPILAAD